MSSSFTTTRPCTSPSAGAGVAATRGADPGRSARAGQRTLALIAAIAAIGLAGCTSGPDDTCNDVSTKICGRLAECTSLSSVFSSEEQCVTSFNGYFEVGGSDDAACRQTWTDTGALGCDQFLAYFEI